MLVQFKITVFHLNIF